jgi:hypothetical protein
MRDCGEYVDGDAFTPLRLALVDAEGVAFDLTGASGITLVGRTIDGEVLNLDGTVQGSATLGRVDFDPPGDSGITIGTRDRLRVVFRVKWTVSGDTRWSPAAGFFTIVRWP